MAGYYNARAVNWPLQDDSPPQTATTYYNNYSRNNSVSRPSTGPGLGPNGRGITRSGTDESTGSRDTVDSGKSGRYATTTRGGPFDEKRAYGGGGRPAASQTAWLDEKVRSPLTTASGERIELRRNDTAISQVVGTTRMYEDGRIRLVPMPTPDPKGMGSTPETVAAPGAAREHGV